MPGSTEKVSLVSAMARISDPQLSARSAANRVLEGHSPLRPVPGRSHAGEFVENAFEDVSEDFVTRRRSYTPPIPGAATSSSMLKPVSIIFAPPNNLARFHQGRAESSSTVGPCITMPFVGELKWKAIKEMGADWFRNPRNWALVVWGLAVFVSGAVLFMVMVGMLNNVLPDKADRDLWFEASNQTINALFTLFVLLLHPIRVLHLVLLLRWRRKDIQNLRNVYCKRGTPKPNEWSHMLVVLLLYQFNCFAQYAVCALNWYYSRAQRPIMGVVVCFVMALSAGCVASIYTSFSPLGKDSPLGEDDAENLGTDKALPPRFLHSPQKYRLLEKDPTLGPRAGDAVENPQWQGGLFDCWEAPTLVAATLCCFPCVLGHNLGRLGFGNRYVHVSTFLLACFAPFVIFELAGVNVDSRNFRQFLRGSGAVVSLCGLFYGGFWRIRMRETYSLPGETWCCGQPILSDFAQWLFCSCCSLCQEVRTAEAFDIISNRFYVKSQRSALSPEPEPDERFGSPSSSSSLQPLPVTSVVRITEIALSNIRDTMLDPPPKQNAFHTDGVNAGHYARELMWNCAERARKVGKTSDPKAVLVYAAERTKSTGTAATLIASLYDQTLRVANIGDSGFVVVRDSTVVARSEPMVRGFNFPYQIGTDGDDPEMAEEYEIQVQKDDVVILGSDGIWDNLFEQQISEIASSVQKAGGGPEVVAKQLVTTANKVGLRRQGMSPFAAAAHAAGYDSYFGGKLDDTTAVVAYVT